MSIQLPDNINTAIESYLKILGQEHNLLQLKFILTFVLRGITLVNYLIEISRAKVIAIDISLVQEKIFWLFFLSNPLILQMLENTIGIEIRNIKISGDRVIIIYN